MSKTHDEMRAIKSRFLDHFGAKIPDLSVGIGWNEDGSRRLEVRVRDQAAKNLVPSDFEGVIVHTLIVGPIVAH